MRRMQNQGLAVARHLQVAVRFLFNLTEMAKQSMNVMPPQIVRDWMLEDRIVGAQMRTVECWR